MSDSSNSRLGAASWPEDGSDALPAGARLAEFEIRQVIGAGGFGIVYRAWDVALQRDVALKEYMPVSLAGRGAGERVTLRSRTHEENFALGLQSFVNEARLLARFDHPALVKVFRFWEANGTAYMAMPLYKGRTLRQLRKEAASRAFDDAWAHALIEPLLGALEVMHDAEVYHRDIAPDNILWCDDKRPVLLDFGAARLVLADRTQNVTAILKPQFAPIEQYAETQSMRQGPWTDLYALAGTCYFMLTGRAPLPATARVMSDEQEPLARLAPAGCSPRLLQALDWAMAVRPKDRPQSVAQFRDALAGRTAIPLHAAAPGPAAPAAPASVSSGPGHEKTIQIARDPAPPRRAPASTPVASVPAARSRHEAALDGADRSVLLPPTPRLPAKPLLLLLVLAAATAGAWTTRHQWMPVLGLQVAASPAAGGASSVEATASVAAASPVASAAVPVAEAASPTSPAAIDAAASAAAAPASEAAALSVPASTPVAAAPPSRPARSVSSELARRRALAARMAALTLPPPVLPPLIQSSAATPPVNGSRAAAPAAVGSAAPDAASPASATAAPASTSPRGPGPREVCADLEPAQVNACVKRLCDNERRYQHYPICLRVHRQEEQQQRGTSE